MESIRNRDKFIWNMIGGLCNAISSMVLLIFVNRIIGSDSGGIFSLAFAVAQMLITVATLEVRNFQSTDLKEEFSFSNYISFRVLSCFAMIIVSLVYLRLNHYTGEKAIVVFFICIYKSIEAFSDVFEGLYQQKERIDLSGKTVAYRVIFSTICFVLTLYISNNLILSCFVLVISSAVVCFLYNSRYVKHFTKIKINFDFHRFVCLFIKCIPLALGAFMIMYIANAPKYAIDRFLDLQTQNYFSILFMPAFVINLFSLFVFRPMLTSITTAWNHQDKMGFMQIMKKAIAWLMIVTLICIVGAYLLGIPVLSLLYGLDLSSYKSELILIMFGGGLNALMTIFRFSLTAIREQNISLIGFFVSFIGSIVITPFLVKDYGIIGACYSYVISMLIMNIVFFIIMLVKVRKWILNFDVKRRNKVESL